MHTQMREMRMAVHGEQHGAVHLDAERLYKGIVGILRHVTLQRRWVKRKQPAFRILLTDARTQSTRTQKLTPLAHLHKKTNKKQQKDTYVLMR